MVRRRFFAGPYGRTCAIGLGLLATALQGGAGAGAATARDKSKAQSAAPGGPCSGYGPGFVKLEGSDTCVRFSGAVAAEMSVGSTPGRWRSTWWPK